jgi:hypothetical protein
VLRIARDASEVEATAHDLVAAADEVSIPPETMVFDPGLEHYAQRLAAYSPTPLPVRLLILASELDGRAWVRLSWDAELVEIPGGHFDWVTRRAGELAARLRSSPSGDVLLGSTKTFPLASEEKMETSSAGPNGAESLRPPARD